MKTYFKNAAFSQGVDQYMRQQRMEMYLAQKEQQKTFKTSELIMLNFHEEYEFPSYYYRIKEIFQSDEAAKERMKKMRELEEMEKPVQNKYGLPDEYVKRVEDELNPNHNNLENQIIYWLAEAKSYGVEEADSDQVRVLVEEIYYEKLENMSLDNNPVKKDVLAFDQDDIDMANLLTGNIDPSAGGKNNIDSTQAYAMQPILEGQTDPKLPPDASPAMIAAAAAAAAGTGGSNPTLNSDKTLMKQMSGGGLNSQGLGDGTNSKPQSRKQSNGSADFGPPANRKQSNMRKQSEAASSVGGAAGAAGNAAASMVSEGEESGYDSERQALKDALEEQMLHEQQEIFNDHLDDQQLQDLLGIDSDESIVYNEGDQRYFEDRTFSPFDNLHKMYQKSDSLKREKEEFQSRFQRVIVNAYKEKLSHKLFDGGDDAEDELFGEGDQRTRSKLKSKSKSKRNEDGFFIEDAYSRPLRLPKKQGSSQKQQLTTEESNMKLNQLVRQSALKNATAELGRTKKSKDPSKSTRISENIFSPNKKSQNQQQYPRSIIEILRDDLQKQLGEEQNERFFDEFEIYGRQSPEKNDFTQMPRQKQPTSMGKSGWNRGDDDFQENDSDEEWERAGKSKRVEEKQKKAADKLFATMRPRQQQQQQQQPSEKGIGSSSNKNQVSFDNSQPEKKQSNSPFGGERLAAKQADRKKRIEAYEKAEKLRMENAQKANGQKYSNTTSANAGSAIEEPSIGLRSVYGNLSGTKSFTPVKQQTAAGNPNTQAQQQQSQYDRSNDRNSRGHGEYNSQQQQQQQQQQQYQQYQQGQQQNYQQYPQQQQQQQQNTGNRFQLNIEKVKQQRNYQEEYQQQQQLYNYIEPQQQQQQQQYQQQTQQQQQAAGKQFNNASFSQQSNYPQQQMYSQPDQQYQQQQQQYLHPNKQQSQQQYFSQQQQQQQQYMSQQQFLSPDSSMMLQSFLQQPEQLGTARSNFSQALQSGRQSQLQSHPHQQLQNPQMMSDHQPQNFHTNSGMGTSSGRSMQGGQAGSQFAQNNSQFQQMQQQQMQQLTPQELQTQQYERACVNLYQALKKTILIQKAILQKQMNLSEDMLMDKYLIELNDMINNNSNTNPHFLFMKLKMFRDEKNLKELVERTQLSMSFQ